MRILTITIPEAEERRELFTKDYPSGLGDFRFFIGKGKGDVIPPCWWVSKRTHWALVENYIAIFELFGDEDLLIFEDDCTFVSGFLEKYNEFMNNVPDDADLIYLGILNRKPPVPLRNGIIQATDGLYSHAIIYKRDYIPFLLKCLKAPRWRGYHGYDERLALLQYHGLLTAYAPEEPLCGQRAGYSFITENERPAFLHTGDRKP